MNSLRLAILVLATSGLQTETFEDAIVRLDSLNPDPPEPSVPDVVEMLKVDPYPRDSLPKRDKRADRARQAEHARGVGRR